MTVGDEVGSAEIATGESLGADDGILLGGSHTPQDILHASFGNKSFEEGPLSVIAQ